MALPFGGFFLSLFLRNLITAGASIVTDKAAKAVAKPTYVATSVKQPSASWTMWFADILLASGIWIEVLPMISDAVAQSNIFGPYTGFALAFIAVVVKILRIKTTQPIA